MDVSTRGFPENRNITSIPLPLRDIACLRSKFECWCFKRSMCFDNHIVGYASARGLTTQPLPSLPPLDQQKPNTSLKILDKGPCMFLYTSGRIPTRGDKTIVHWAQAQSYIPEKQKHTLQKNIRHAISHTHIRAITSFPISYPFRSVP